MKKDKKKDWASFFKEKWTNVLKNKPKDFKAGMFLVNDKNIDMPFVFDEELPTNRDIVNIIDLLVENGISESQALKTIEIIRSYIINNINSNYTIRFPQLFDVYLSAYRIIRPIKGMFFWIAGYTPMVYMDGNLKRTIKKKLKIDAERN